MKEKKPVGRPRAKNSKVPLFGLGLDKREEEELQAILKAKERSYKAIARMLIRDWIKENNRCKECGGTITNHQRLCPTLYGKVHQQQRHH